MTEVIEFPKEARHEVEPDVVLSEAMGQLTDVVVVGWDKDGNDFYHSSMADAKQAYWHLARAQWRLMRMCDAMEEGGD